MCYDIVRRTASDARAPDTGAARGDAFVESGNGIDANDDAEMASDIQDSIIILN